MDFLRRLAAPLDNDAITWKTLLITFSVGEFALESFLLYRHYRVLQRTKIPNQLKQEVDQPTFDKSQAYGRSKAKYITVNGIWGQIKNYITIQHDWLPYLWSTAGYLCARYAPRGYQGEITQSLVFVFSMSLIDMALGLPFELYYHFVLEEKYGFNKQTIGLYITDKIKGFGLSLLFGVPLGAAFLKIIQKTGDNFFLYIWVFMLVVQLGAVLLYPTFIVPMFNKLTPLEPGELKTRVEALASKLNFPLKELQVIDGSKRSAHSNAYFTGLPYLPKKIVIYDTLLNKATPPEVEAVLAHELGHWKMGHTSKLMGIASFHLFWVFSLFSVFINNGSLYRAFGFIRERPIIIGFILFNDVLSPTDSIVKLGMNVLTRKYEFEADAFGKKLGYAKDLAASLIKLQIQNLSSMDADPYYSAYHYSHPILTERLKAVGWTSEKKVGDGKIDIQGKGNVINKPEKEL